MLLQAIGAVLPAGLAVALSPFPVIAIVLILASRHGRRNGPLFALGWVVGLTAVTVVVVAVLGGADDPDSSSAAVADWMRVIGGSLFIILGARKWAARPRAEEAVEMPGWMAALDDATAGRALGLGALLGGANPKNLVLSAAAAASIAESGVDDSDLGVAIGLFVLVGSCTVLGAVAVRLVGGRRGEAALESLRGFMVANGAVITVVVFLLLGAKVLGDGLSGLGR